jgi:hypothetical protein
MSASIWDNGWGSEGAIMALVVGEGVGGGGREYVGGVHFGVSIVSTIPVSTYIMPHTVPMPIILGGSGGGGGGTAGGAMGRPGEQPLLRHGIEDELLLLLLRSHRQLVH